MRGMLIDDDDSVAGLRDDIAVMDLRPRGAERRIEYPPARAAAAWARVSAAIASPMSARSPEAGAALSAKPG